MSLRLILRSVPLAAIAIVAACSERLDTSSTCPVLCTSNALVFKDTTFDVVQFDSAYTGFTGVGERWPAPGLATQDVNGFLYETYFPVVNRTDSVDIRQILRFDTLSTVVSLTDTTPITAVTASKLLLVVDTSRSSIPPGTHQLSLYDVDDATATDDTSAAVLATRFTPGRLISTRVFKREEVYGDTIPGSGAAVTIRSFTVDIPDSVMLRFIKSAKRVRLGLRITSSASLALRFVAPSVRAPDLTPRISYDASPDTAVKPWVIQTQYRGTASPQDRYRAQTLVLRDRTVPLNDGSLEAGGMVGVRSVLRLKIPRSFLDTVTIVRASLDLTQRPQRTAPGATEGVRVRLRIGIAGPALLGDPRRLAEVLDPTLEGVQLPSLRLMVADSGVKAFEVGGALERWVAQDTSVATNFILYSEGETLQEQRPAFFSTRAANRALRPRLRVTYTTRREGAIP